MTLMLLAVSTRCPRCPERWRLGRPALRWFLLQTVPTSAGGRKALGNFRRDQTFRGRADLRNEQIRRQTSDKKHLEFVVPEAIRPKYIFVSDTLMTVRGEHGVLRQTRKMDWTHAL